MGDGTGIQWTDATWNPLRARHLATAAEGWSCARVSPGCKNCYASTLNESQRWGRGTGLDYTVRNLERVEHYIDEGTLTQPLRWKKARRVFVCSMTDLFGEWVEDIEIERIFEVMENARQHTFQVLTKRPERMRDFMRRRKQRDIDYAEAFKSTPTEAMQNSPAAKAARKRADQAGAPNIWLGVSVEDQERADERIPLLLDTPAAVRFLSCEPLLGAVALRRVKVPPLEGYRYDEVHWLDTLDGSRSRVPHESYEHLYGSTRPRIDWVIVGGESGPGARPFDLAWARSIVQQCQDAGVAVFVKQLGAKPVGTFSLLGDGGTAKQDGWKLRHAHGGNPDEWPEDLRVREWPGTAVSA